MIEELKPEMIDLNSIKPVEPKALFDAKKYEGSKTKIAEVKVIWVDSHYVNGNYDANKTVKLPKVEITTDVIDTYGDGENKKDITVQQRFSLQQDDTGALVISKHPKGKLWKFMRKMGAMTLEELKGKTVSLTAEPSTDENDDRLWLRIVV